MEEFLVVLLLGYGFGVLIWILGKAYERIYLKRLKRLLKQLNSSDQDQRTQASNELITMGSSAVKPLIKMLQDKEPVIRKGAAKALGIMGDSSAAEPLMRAVKDKDKAVRYEAVTALGGIGGFTASGNIRAFTGEFLVRILEDKSYEQGMRWRAAAALGETGRILGVKPLIRTLEEPDLTIRKKAIGALGKIGNSQAEEPLVTMLDDKAPDVRALAAEALDKLHWKPITYQEHISYNIAKGNWDSPLLSTPAAIEPLLRMLEDERPENVNARVNAVMILGKIGETRAVEPLIKMLGHELPNIRETAATALGDIGDLSTVEPLVRVLKDENANVRMAVVTALGEIGDIRSLKALIQVVGGKNPAVFGDRNPEVQQKAVEALGNIEDEQATTALIYALGNDDVIVRFQAAEVLDRRRWTPQQDMQQIAYHIARANWDALVPFGTQAIAPLIKIIHDQDREVRQQVAETLKKTLVCVHTMIFGSVNVENPNRRRNLNNLDVSELTIPMPKLRNVVVHAETHNFHLVERFMTYAINYIGQKYLKKHVLVHIYGDPDKLHPNLRNSFKNLCKRVVVHKGSKLQ